MKTVSDSDGSQMDAGRLFHTRGPSTAKDRSPNVVRVGGTSSLIVDDDDPRLDRRRRIKRQSTVLIKSRKKVSETKRVKYKYFTYLLKFTSC